MAAGSLYVIMNPAAENHLLLGRSIDTGLVSGLNDTSALPAALYP